MFSQRLVDTFVALKENLYRCLGFVAGLSFNLLNLLLNGNLPPFGSACVVVRRDERYLVLEHENGNLCLPGGFVRWREDPIETAARECREETGLAVDILDLVGCFFTPARSWGRMSTLTMLYSARLRGGHLHQALEGRPCWLLEAEVRRRLTAYYQPLFESYLRYYDQHSLPASGPVQIP